MAALLAVQGALAQEGDATLTRLRAEWPDQTSVYLEHNTTYRIERTKEGYEVHRRTEDRELMLKDQSSNSQERSVGYSELIPLEELEAYTLVPTGKGQKKLPVGAIDHHDVRGENVFHDDNQRASFMMPSLVAGAIAVVDHTISYPDHRMITGHFFGAERPVERSCLTVICDQSLDVDVRTFHIADSALERSDAIERGKRVVRLVMRHVATLPLEGNAPGPRYYAPHALVVLRPAGSDRAGDLDRMYAWYSTFLEDGTQEPTAELKALSDSIVGDATAPRDRAARLYKWVQDRIHYVAFEDGMNGLVPAPAEQVHRSGYGDCKGMSHLLCTLMRAQGLDSHLAWVGTRDLPYRYTEVATSDCDNHMVVALELADSTVIVDATAGLNAFGVPSGFIQGKQVLIALAPDRYAVHEVPVMPPSFSALVDSVHVRMDGAALAGSGVLTATGYDRYYLVQWLKNATPARRDHLMRSILMKGSNKFLLDTAAVEGTDDPEAPLVIRYRFHIPDHVRISGSRAYMPIVLTDPWEGIRYNKDRKLPIDVDHCSDRRYVVDLELPAGATCRDLPITGGVNEDAFGYSLAIRGDARSVKATSTFRMNRLLIDQERPMWERLNRSLLPDLGRILVIDTP